MPATKFWNSTKKILKKKKIVSLFKVCLGKKQTTKLLYRHQHFMVRLLMWFKITHAKFGPQHVDHST